MVNTSVDLGGLRMPTFLATASGTFGYGFEYVGAADYSKLGAVTAKGIRTEPWPGNAMPRHSEVPGGLVNAIGLQGTGVEHFLKYTVPWYRQQVKGVPLIANIWGSSVEGYAEVAAQMGDKVDAVEMNVSCPNVKAGGHTFGQDPKVLAEVVGAVRKATKLPLIVKLAPNVPSIVPYVKACEDAGADALSMINTIPAMVIDVERRVPVLANVTGGLSRDGRSLRGEGRGRVPSRRRYGSRRRNCDVLEPGGDRRSPRRRRRILRTPRLRVRLRPDRRPRDAVA